MTKEQQEAIAALKAHIEEMIRDHDDEEYYSQSRMWRSAGSALDALLVERERAMRDAVAALKQASRLATHDDVVARIDGYAVELADKENVTRG